MKIGGLELVEVDYLCKTFGITRRGAFKWLKVLRITTLNISKEAYFSLESLELTLRVIAESGIVFSMPGSDKRQCDHEACRGLTELTNKMRKRVCDVQAQKINNLNNEVVQWEKKTKEIQKAQKALQLTRKAIRDVSRGVQHLPKKD